MIPISDANPSKNRPTITLSFIAICILIYIFIIPQNSADFNEFLYRYAAIPCEILLNTPLTDTQYYTNNCSATQGINIFPNKTIIYSIFYSPFLHAGFLHLLGNIWSLWIFGDNVEDVLGRFKTIMFILITSLVSIYGHSILNPSSVTPVVGASGVVAAFMGAYLYIFPNAKILAFLLIPFWMPITIKARTFMIFWIFSQLLLTIQITNISWEAHLFGFITGYVVVKYFYRLKR